MDYYNTEFYYDEEELEYDEDTIDNLDTEDNEEDLDEEIIYKKEKKIKENYYVNNKEFYNELVEYLNICKECEDTNKKLPVIPDNLAYKIIKIANKLSYRPNFINYTFKNEMKSDAIYYCIKYLRKFNPEKSNNPFAYFTQICYNAFVRRIKLEDKNTAIKTKLSEHSDVLNQYNNFNKRNSKNT